MQHIEELEHDANKILASKYWESAGEFLSAMNKKTIEKVAAGKAKDMSEIMLDYAPHALERGRQALVKAKKGKRAKN